MITVTKISLLTGDTNKVVLPITQDDYNKAEQARKEGMLIQDAYPTLSLAEREFLISGVTPEEWDKFFSEIN